jgi:ADP-ribose diphosphatase
MNQEDIKICQERYLYQGFLSVKQVQLQHKLFAGGWSPTITRELVVRPSAAALLPYDPVLDTIVMIEQFRVGALTDSSPWLVEIVAGLIDQEETAAEVVNREAKEEAGLEVLELIPIYEYWASPGFTNELVSLFCGRVDASNAGGIHGLAEEHEDIQVNCVKASDAFTMMRQGKIKNAICLIALMWLELNHAKIRQNWLG